MSWTRSLPQSVEVNDAAEALEQIRHVPERLEGAPLEQFEAARVAALNIISSGAVGTRPVRISLSGHANPGHEPTEGWANDMVVVSISQA